MSAWGRERDDRPGVSPLPSRCPTRAARAAPRAAGLTFAAIGAQLGVSDGQRFGLIRKTQDEPDPESGHTETIWARGTCS